MESIMASGEDARNAGNAWEFKVRALRIARLRATNPVTKSRCVIANFILPQVFGASLIT